MTRINLIPPAELHRKHLGAEWYELPEIFKLVAKRQARGHIPAHCDIPLTYRFGAGHKTFFYDKLGWLSDRYLSLHTEMLRRGYDPTIQLSLTSYTEARKWCGLEYHWWGQWTPTQSAIDLSRARIEQRVKELGLS